jgi:hypothetical protein
MRNERGEDWPKMLKELNRIAPHVPIDAGAGGSAVPILNRQQARRLGFQTKGEAMATIDKMGERLASIEAHKHHLIDQWFEAQLSKCLPPWLLKQAAKHLWILKVMGFRYGFSDAMHQEAGMPKPMPATIVWLDWLKWQLAAERMVWGDGSQILHTP